MTGIPIGKSLSRLPILLYHDIYDDEIQTPFSIHYHKLSLQFYHLRNNGYTAITTKQLLDFMNFGFPLPEKSVLITFDDGYRSIATHLYPLLQQFDLKATAFIVPSFVQKKEDCANRYLSLSEMREIGEDYIEWGIHSYSHINYKTLTAQQLAFDIHLCNHWFELYKIPFVQALAFPFGAYPKYNFVKRKRFFLALKLSGIKLFFRIGNRINKLTGIDSVLMERIDIVGNETIQLFDGYLREGKRKRLPIL
jgi:peptidoglycan/xylan/chitin deacetylase (PgdA/CDA1 family)